MNRYLLGFILGAIAFLTLLGIGNSRQLFRRAGDASRESISATPTAAEPLSQSGIESAGQNVLRQTSEEAIQRSQDLTTNNQQPATQTTPTPAATTPPVAPEPATPAPATPPTDQEAIPALW
ncbi:MAG: hypothetical protein AAF722_16245 [Cyanobacteria bacterium P01_C01_bin.70]